MSTYYLWNLVRAQDGCHVEIDIGVGSTNNSYRIVLKITLIVWDESVLCGEKFHWGMHSLYWIEIVVIDIEAQGGVGYELGIIIDFLYCKYQSQDVLVDLDHYPAMRIIAWVTVHQIQNFECIISKTFVACGICKRLKIVLQVKLSMLFKYLQKQNYLHTTDRSQHLFYIMHHNPAVSGRDFWLLQTSPKPLPSVEFPSGRKPQFSRA